jgi:hypothetical protein
MVNKKITTIHSRTLGKFMNDVENKIISDRRDLSRYIDSLSTKLNDTIKYNEYLAAQLDRALERISQLEHYQ